MFLTRIAALSLCVTACGPAVVDNDGSRIAMAEESVKAKLRDGGSAEFSGVAVHDYQGKPVVCGSVNSKNGFGGMSGNQGFIVAGDVVVLEEEGAPGAFAEAQATFC